jgi:hypothetical protein
MASDEVDQPLAAPMAPIFNTPSPTAPITHPVAPAAEPPAPTAPIVHPPASLAPISHPVAPTPTPDDLGLPRRVPGEAAGAPSFSEVTPPVGAPTPTASDGALPRRTPARRGPFEPKGAEGLIGTSRRPAEEIRNILSSYRSGLSSGRADAPTAEGAEPTPAPSGAPEIPEQ